MKVARFDVKNKKIGENTFYVRPLPPLTALRLYGDLQKTLTASLRGGLTTKGESDSITETLLNSDINIGNIIAQLGANFNGEVLTQFTERLLDKDYVSVKPKGETEAVVLDEQMVNELFTGNILEMFKLEFFVIEVNFGDFFDLIPNLSGLQKRLATK